MKQDKVDIVAAHIARSIVNNDEDDMSRMKNQMKNTEMM